MKLKLCLPVAFVLTAVLGVGGCTWVDAVPGSSRVTLVMPEHVTQCHPLGSTVSHVTDKIGIINRDEATVTEELLTLAKNSAVELGGDTLVAESGPVDGSQKFDVYNCK
jgi:hypothetical protein